MKLAVCALLLIVLVTVKAQGGVFSRGKRDLGRNGGRPMRASAGCKYGPPMVSECVGEEFTISRPVVSEGIECPKREKTGKCIANSGGIMVPVTNVINLPECYYTLPDMTTACDPTTKTMTLTQTLVSEAVEGCEETFVATIQCSEKSEGQLIPDFSEMRRIHRSIFVKKEGKRGGNGKGGKGKGGNGRGGRGSQGRGGQGRGGQGRGGQGRGGRGGKGKGGNGRGGHGRGGQGRGSQGRGGQGRGGQGKDGSRGGGRRTEINNA